MCIQTFYPFKTFLQVIRNSRVPTIKRTDSVFILQSNRSMLCGEIVSVYCGNCTGHVATIWCARSKRKSDNQCIISVLFRSKVYVN